jgi:hypothetical protein
VSCPLSSPPSRLLFSPFSLFSPLSSHVLSLVTARQGLPCSLSLLCSTCANSPMPASTCAPASSLPPSRCLSRVLLMTVSFPHMLPIVLHARLPIAVLPVSERPGWHYPPYVLSSFRQWTPRHESVASDVASIDTRAADGRTGEAAPHKSESKSHLGPALDDDGVLEFSIGDRLVLVGQVLVGKRRLQSV